MGKSVSKFQEFLDTLSDATHGDPEIKIPALEILAQGDVMYLEILALAVLSLPEDQLRGWFERVVNEPVASSALDVDK